MATRLVPSPGPSCVVVSVCSVALALTLGSGRVGLAQVPFGPAQNPLAGAQIFGAKGCVRCHSINGLGGRIGPDLAQIPQRRSFYELAAAMWNHIGPMAKRMREEGIERPQLDAQQVGDLIAFLYTLDYFDPPGDVEVGKRLFTEKSCVRCHQVQGYGGVIGPNLDFVSQYGSPIMVAAAMWDHGPAMSEAMRSRGIERPTFTASELIDLMSYLESTSERPPEGSLYVLPGRADEGRRLFTQKSCIQCHSVAGRGGRVGPDLARLGRKLSLAGFAAAMWNKAPAMTREMRARDIGVPQLTAAEMADIVAYLYSVQYFAESGNARRGSALLRSQGCLDCHSLNGRGGETAPDLEQAKGLESPAAVIAALWSHIALEVPGPEVPARAWPQLSADQIADLTVFLQSLERSH